MDAKLRDYRAQRRRAESINKTKEFAYKIIYNLWFYPKHISLILFCFFSKAVMDIMAKKVTEVKMVVEYDEPVPENVTELDPSDEELELEPDENHVEVPINRKLVIVKLVISTLIYLALYMYFLYMQFGAVFFVISSMIAIYYNTSTGPKKKGEMSAYSVFNKDCHSIDGTLKAEQFEREIRYGARSV